MVNKNKKIITFSLAFPILVIFFFEIIFGIVFWFKDVSDQLIHIPLTKDAAYIYYKAEADDLNEDGYFFTRPIRKSDGVFRNKHKARGFISDE